MKQGNDISYWLILPCGAGHGKGSEESLSPGIWREDIGGTASGE